MNLEETLRDLGYQLKSEGQGNYRILGYGGLIVKDQYWYSHTKGEGGHASSLLRFLGHSEVQQRACLSKPSKKRQQVKVLNLTHSLKNLSSRGRHYLQKRCIDTQLIDLLEKEQLIREDTKGYIAFIGFDPQRRERCISKRAITPIHFVQRYEAQGSNKKWSFSFPFTTNHDTVILCEGPMDALSIACLEHRKYQLGYLQSYKIATCGAPVYRMLSRLRYINPKKIYLAFDRDQAGASMAKKAREVLKHMKIPILDAIPGKGKDPNDWLKNTMF